MRARVAERALYFKAIYQRGAKFKALQKCFSDKHQELDLPSQVHVEEDEDEVEEEENEQSLRSNRGNDVLEEEEECPETKQDEVDPEAVNNSTTSVCPRLMEKIDAAKDVSDHTTFGSSDIPPMGVWTDHQPELEKVRAPREKCSAFFAFEVKQRLESTGKTKEFFLQQPLYVKHVTETVFNAFCT